MTRGRMIGIAIGMALGIAGGIGGYTFVYAGARRT